MKHLRRFWEAQLALLVFAAVPVLAVIPVWLMGRFDNLLWLLLWLPLAGLWWVVASWAADLP